MGAQRDSRARRICEVTSLHQSRTLEDQMSNVTRRDFLKYLGAGALGLIARPRVLSAFERGPFRLDDPSDVVQCFHEGATTGNTINEPVVQIMVDESIK
ncbi:twin-arginine translocation signal domain-containing protein, partial [candidate division WOR-3 bacterium]|nr:twin-arginine translocation signal domain-containing protein [candidate division WOR-3 bacterium]